MDRITTRSLVLSYVAVGLLLFTGKAGWTASFSTNITIRAEVLPFAKLTSFRQQENIRISETDARRGFVEIQNGSVVEIKNNTLSGCYLMVEVNGFPFVWALLNLQGREVTLPERGGLIHWPLSGNIITAIHYVIALKPGTRPGVYPWPFHLTVSPILP